MAAIGAGIGSYLSGVPPAAAKMSPEQQALMEQQVSALNAARGSAAQQYGISQQINPLLLARLGIQSTAPTYGTAANFAGQGWVQHGDTGFYVAPDGSGLYQYDQGSGQMIPTRAGQRPVTAGIASPFTDIYGSQIQAATLGQLGLARQYQQNASNAMSGNLEGMNPALTEYLNQQMRDFQARSNAQFTSAGAPLATPYQNALYYQNLARTNALAGNQLNYMNTYQNLANAALAGSGVASAPGVINQGLGQAASIGGQNLGVAQSYANPLANLAHQQMLNYQSGFNQWQANLNRNMALGASVGQAGQMAAMAAAGGGLGGAAGAGAGLSGSGSGGSSFVPVGGGTPGGLGGGYYSGYYGAGGGQYM